MGTSRTGAAGATARIQVSRTGQVAPAPRTGLKAPAAAVPVKQVAPTPRTGLKGPKTVPSALPLDEVLIGDCIAALEKLPP